MPLIGRLFHNLTKTEETRNLLILIKPTINPSRRARAPMKFVPLESFATDDPLIKKLEAKLKHSDKPKD